MAPAVPIDGAGQNEDHGDFFVELKYDGFCALAYLDRGACRLVSRKNHIYKAYAAGCEWIGKHMRHVVLDGELACHDEKESRGSTRSCTPRRSLFGGFRPALAEYPRLPRPAADRPQWRDP